MEVKTGGLWELTDQARVVTFIGASGKTTSLVRLAEELNRTGQRFVLTTTTKVFPFNLDSIWQSWVSPPPLDDGQSWFWYGQPEAKTGKWVGPPLSVIDQGIRASDNTIWGIEGDGARSQQLKCWAANEPQIPEETRWVVLLLNASLWGKMLLAEDVHRPHCCPERIGRTWDAESCWEYLRQSPVSDPQYAGYRWAVLFNDHRSSGVGNLDEILRQLSASWSLERTRFPALRLATGSVKGGALRWLDLS